jgi:hypothetical protein
MSSGEKDPDSAGIPQQIIAKFLDQLTAEKVSPTIVARLKKTLLEDGDISEEALKAALTAKDDVHD